MWKSNYKVSKCQSCKNALGKTACSWARNFTPVEGWRADPTVISAGSVVEETSYCVYYCPNYERGNSDVEWGSGDYRRLLMDILYQAIADWKALNCGQIESLRYKSEVIKSEELIHFFNSKYFEWLVRLTINVDPGEIRSALKIPEGRGCVI